MAQLSNPKSLKKKITASRLCLFEKKLHHSDQIWGRGEKSPVINIDSRKHTHTHPGVSNSNATPSFGHCPPAAGPAAAAPGERCCRCPSALQMPSSVADTHRHYRYPSALQMPSGITDAQLSHPKGHSSLAGAAHFSPAKPPLPLATASC